MAFNVNGVYSGQIGAVGSGDLYIASKSTYPAIVVKDGGNVGIGTTSPLTALTVSGNLSLFNTNQLRYYNSAKNNWTQVDSPLLSGDTEVDFRVMTKTGTFYINASGNVGIGTTSNITGKLTISSSSGDQIKLDRTGQTSRGIVISGSDNLSIGTWADPTQISITPSGNVGIGTTAPSEKLTVTNGKLFLTEADTSIGGKIYGYNDTSVNLYSGGLKFQSRYYNGSDYVFADRMTINSSGNVGIGTTSPSRLLSLGGAAYVDVVLKSTSASGVAGGGTLYFGNSSTDSSGILNYEHGGNFMNFFTAGSERMRITSSGNVGIGTTAPSTKLDVVGAITASGGFFNSDIRLKELVDYKYSVADIKPITYLWKDGRDDKRHVGYSAQAIREVMPDAVNEGKDGMLSVNYVEVLVAKIAELENRIKLLENGLE